MAISLVVCEEHHVESMHPHLLSTRSGLSSLVLLLLLTSFEAALSWPGNPESALVKENVDAAIPPA